MKIADYQKRIHRKEGLKVKTPIAQIREILKIIRGDIKEKCNVDIYSLIRKIT